MQNYKVFETYVDIIYNILFFLTAITDVINRHQILHIKSIHVTFYT